jgi:hypothetical protein
MTPRPRSSRFLEAPTARVGAATLTALGSTLALVVLLAPAPARAQACCVGTGLVTPARLRIFENYGAGVQTRVRSVSGAFHDNGSHAAARSGDDEFDLEQDLFAAARAGEHFQASIKMPFVETGRRETGVSAFGGGLGDVSANLRYDLTFAGDRPWWPGIAVLAGLSIPTGRTVEDSNDPTGATGIGSYEANLGLSVEQVVGRSFLSVTGFVAQQTARTVGPITQTFGPRVTALLTGGYAFAHELTVGAYVLGTRRRDEKLVTAGAAIAIPLSDNWRVHGTLSDDLPFSGWGRNQLTGATVSASLLRVWL